MREILIEIAGIVGRKPPTLRLPTGVVLPIAYVAEGFARLTGRPGRITVEGVRMARKRMFFSPAKAVRELGLPQTDVREALRDAVEWFGAHGYTRVAPAVKTAAS